ncbi:Uncharacterised protein [Mycobacteroides abscessus]|nr:Uncharacterised protein [Mycobacteroides abscessus]
MNLGFKLARWWLRWPVYSTLFFLVLVALSWDGKTHAGWLITLASFAAVVGFGAALSDRKDSLAAREVVEDLSPQERSQATRATRTGPVPAVQLYYRQLRGSLSPISARRETHGGS